MEGIKEFYTYTNWNNIWRLSYEVQDYIHKKMASNNISQGDIVYFESYPNKVKRSDIDEYLETLGARRTTNRNQASMILTNSIAFEDKGIPLQWKIKPDKELDLSEFDHKMFLFRIKDKIVKYSESKRVKLDFNEDCLEDIWRLLTSKKEQDIKIAAGMIMSIDWSEHLPVLYVLFYKLNGIWRYGKLSTIPGWSNFANNLNLPWKSSCLPASMILHDIFGKDQLLSENHIKILNKLFKLKN